MDAGNVTAGTVTDRPLRILFVVPYFYPAWPYGGAMRSAYELARALVSRGHRVKVLTTDSGGESRLALETKNAEAGVSAVSVASVEGVEVFYYRNVSNGLAFKQRVFWPPEYFRKIEAHMTECDILHIHEFRSTIAPSAYKAARRAGIPYVVSPHGGLRHLGKGLAKSVYDALFGNAILKHVSMLAAVSPVEERDAQEFGVDAARIRLLPNTVAPQEYTPLPSRDAFKSRWSIRAERVFLFLGRLHRIKGADILIQAFARIVKSHSGVHLAIAGPDDGQEPELRNLARSSGVADRVTFTGFLDHARKLEALAGSDALVIPSRSEVFAIAALEALVCGLPIVLSSACGLAPRPGGEYGLHLFQSEDVDDLERVLANFLGTPPKPDIEAGRAFVAREFSPTAIASKAEALYVDARRGYNQEL